MLKKRNVGFIYLSLFVALILTVMPLPEMVQSARPDWVLLVLAYWNLALPHRVSVLSAFVCGFLVDVLVGTTLGVNAIAFSGFIFILEILYLRVRNFSKFQQVLFMGLLLTLYQFVLFWLSYLLTGVNFMPEYLLPVATGMIMWPWIFWLLRRYRRRLKIQ